MLEHWAWVVSQPGYKSCRDFSDHEMAMTLFNFVLVSQDAMSSGVVFGSQHLADHPAALTKVHEEQDRVRRGHHDRPASRELLDDMPHLKAVVRESLLSSSSIKVAISLNCLYLCRFLKKLPKRFRSETTTLCPPVL